MARNPVAARCVQGIRPSDDRSTVQGLTMLKLRTGHRLTMIVVSTTLAARHADSFNDIKMDTSDGEGHHVTVVGSAVNSSRAVSTDIHGDARSPMSVASTTVADGKQTTMRTTAKLIS